MESVSNLRKVLISGGRGYVIKATGFDIGFEFAYPLLYESYSDIAFNVVRHIDFYFIE